VLAQLARAAPSARAGVARALARRAGICAQNRRELGERAWLSSGDGRAHERVAHARTPHSSTTTMRVSPGIVHSSLALAALFLAACGGNGAQAENPENAGFLRNSEPAAQTPSAKPDAAPTALSSVVTPPAPQTERVAPEPSQVPQPVEASAPLAQPRSEVALEQQGNAALQSGDFPRAAGAFSDLLLGEVAASEPEDRAALARWSAALAQAQQGFRWNRRGAWPAVEMQVKDGDSLIAIRKRFLSEHPGSLMCTGLIARANQLANERAIRPKDTLRIPSEPASVLVDLSAMWIFYRIGTQVVDAWEVGIGKDGSATQPGAYTIGLKQKEPMWFPTGRSPVPYGDPQNPLGTRWMAWFRDGHEVSHLGIHGTNDPAGVGRRVSEGCIRMRNAEVEALFEILPEGAPVVVQP
jgi:hypothetical protein